MSIVQEKFINPYDEETFWDELMERLAVRDVAREYGVKKFGQLEGLERVTIIERARERYEKVLGEKGLDCIELTESHNS